MNTINQDQKLHVYNMGWNKYSKYIVQQNNLGTTNDTKEYNKDKWCVYINIYISNLHND